MSRQAARHTQETPSRARLAGASPLQRKCTCGNHVIAGGDCRECAGKKMLLQRKLTIATSDDPLEREADRVTERAMAHFPGARHDLSQVRAAPSRLMRREPGASTSYREDMTVTEQGLFEAYQRDCAGLTTLKKLEKTERSFSPREEVHRLERIVERLPEILKKREEKRGRITLSLPIITEHLKGRSVWGPLGRPASVERNERESALEEQLKLSQELHDWEKLVIEPQFGKDYVLGSAESELARAQCELSRARWQFQVYARTGTLPERRVLR